MATLTVTTAQGVGAGSLAEAIEAANALPGGDTIIFAEGIDVVSLEAELPVITDRLTILGDDDGDGQADVVVDANADGDGDPSTSVAAGAPVVAARRAFDVGWATTAAFDGIVVTGGAPADGGGGGIRGSATSTIVLTNSLVERNMTVAGNGDGGGVLAAEVTVANSTIRENATAGSAADGGGVAAGYLTLDGSVVADNLTTGERSTGGGVFAQAAEITASAIHGNATTGTEADGGGVAVAFVEMTNSTVAFNTTAGIEADGAGIFTGSPTLNHVTVTGNSAAGEGTDGGGVFVANKAESGFYNSIFVGNAAAVGADLFAPAGIASAAVNLVGGDADDVFAATQAVLSDTDGDGVADADTGLLAGSLAANGGPTPTAMLLADGPAVDAADEDRAAADDQRGVARPQGEQSDLGALEREPLIDGAVERGDVLYAINAGGGTVTDFSGTPDGVAIDFAADSGGFLAGAGAQQRTFVSDLYGGFDSILGSERFDPAWGDEMLWQLPVAAGTEVVVDLYFGEIYEPFAAAGERIFDVVVEGGLLLDDYDTVAAAGFGTLVVETGVVTVGEDGVLDVAFDHGGADNPKISALAVYAAETSEEGPVTDASAGGDAPDLQWSMAAESGERLDLEDAVLAGEVAIFVANASTVSEVTFYLDDSAAEGAPLQVEELLDPEIAAAGLWDTATVEDGEHSLTAEVLYEDGSLQTVTETFVVDNIL